jgi:pantoate--beta-alanine ligase
MKPVLVRTIRDLRQTLDDGTGSLGLVPTMGALHAGHASLIERARAQNGRVIVTIFVNPLQFNQQSDLDTYPRTLEADTDFCERRGVDVIFAPAVEEIYPAPPLCTVDVGMLDDHLCGPFRPGHFPGVATVVLKLFNIVRADRAYFGEKDAQQLAIVRRMVLDLNVPVTIVGVETVREADGLAMSSRNTRLTADERAVAPALYRAITSAALEIARGVVNAEAIRRHAVLTLPDSPLLRLEYLESVDPDTMQPVAEIHQPVRVAAALWVGSTRLIDNVLVRPPAGT